MSVIDTDTIAGLEVDGPWTVGGGVPFCTLEARIGNKDTGWLHSIAMLDLGEVSDLIVELQAMQAQMERMEADR